MSTRPGIRAAERFAAAYDADPGHARHVARNSLALFDALRDLHQLDHHARTLLHAAALLHDIGYSRNPATHHKQSRDLILASGIEGFSPDDLKIVACVARYHRKTLPEPRHKVYRDLDTTGQDCVRRLAAILRIADGLDRSHAASAQSISVERKGDTLRIRVRQSRKMPVDIQAGVKKSDLFEQVFGRKVEIVSEQAR